jgi:hypothetical protein
MTRKQLAIKVKAVLGVFEVAAMVQVPVDTVSAQSVVNEPCTDQQSLAFRKDVLDAGPA